MSFLFAEKQRLLPQGENWMQIPSFSSPVWQTRVYSHRVSSCFSRAVLDRSGKFESASDDATRAWKMSSMLFGTWFAELLHMSAELLLRMSTEQAWVG